MRSRRRRSAAERGRYPSFNGSLWSQGILPIVRSRILAEARGGLAMDRASTLDWPSLRNGHDHRHPKLDVWRLPDATISNICGVAQSIEPAYQNLMSNPTCQAISLS